ncbi:MAG: hypothetical protein ACLGQX_10625 [Acidobacteriota bacterium]
MHLRNRHLACLLLLLSSLSAKQDTQRAFFARWGGTQARAFRRAELSLGGGYLCSLLLQIQRSAAAGMSQPPARGADTLPKETLALPPAHRVLAASVWSMYPPAEQTAALETVTSRLS